MAIQDRRRGPRFNVHQPVHFIRKEARRDCRSLNISLEGIKIETDREVRPDELLDLTMLVGESLVKARGRVIYVEELPDGTFHAGIAFQEISEHGQASLRKYLSDIMTHGVQRRGILRKIE